MIKIHSKQQNYWIYCKNDALNYNKILGQILVYGIHPNLDIASLQEKINKN